MPSRGASVDVITKPVQRCKVGLKLQTQQDNNEITIAMSGWWRGIKGQMIRRWEMMGTIKTLYGVLKEFTYSRKIIFSV